MTLNQLEYFCAVCRYHSITRAAAALYVSQPTISMAIKELETEFGLELFVHAKNHIYLTEEGERFYARAENLIHASQSIYSDFSRKKWADKPLRIGIPPLISAVFFPALCRQFTRATGINVQLLEYASVRACELTARGELDLALVNLDFHGMEQFAQVVLMEDETVYCVAKTHSLAQKPQVSLEELLEEDHIFYNRDSVHNQTLMSLFQSMGEIPRVVLYSSQLSTMMSFLRQGDCGAFLYGSIEVGEDFLKLPFVPKVTTKFGLIWNRDNTRKKGKAFVEFAQKNIKNLVIKRNCNRIEDKEKQIRD